MVETIFILNRNKSVIGFLSNNGVSPDTPFFDDIYNQELVNGAETYEFSTWSNAITSEILDLGNYVVFKYDNKHKLFQIMDMSEDHKEGQQTISCYCEMAALELLTDYCEPFSVEGNIEVFFNAALQDTNWVLGYVSPTLVTNIQQVKLEKYSNVYKLIQDNIVTFGNIEIEYRVEFDGNKLLGFFIDVYGNGERGNLVYKRFEYGENVDGITKNKNLYDFASAMIGVGKDNINFKEVEWKKSVGDPADKPLGQDFIVDLGANDKFNKHGKYIKGIYENTDITNGPDLLLKTWERLQEVKEPKFDYDVSLALVETEYEEIKIGDTDYVIDTDYNPPVYLEARVGKLELSFTDSSKNKCTLSNYKEVKSKIKEIQDGKTPRIGDNGNWWIDGEDTGQPVQGENGISVEEVVIQYAKGDSTTTAPTADWDSSMPSYSEGYYLWVRTRVKYSNSDSYVYSAPICDQSWKVLTQTYSQYKQLQDKFTWLVKSGTSESSMMLTDTLFSLISKNISLTADRINLNGYVSNSSSNWSINAEGDMNVSNLDVEGYLSTNELRVGNIKCSLLPSKVSSATTIYVDSTVSDDSDDFEDGAHYYTLQGAIDAVPAILNGCDIVINLNKNVREDIEIRGLSGGAFILYLNSNTIYGNVRVKDNGCRVLCYGGSSNAEPTVLGTIKPNTMISAVSREASVVVQSSNFVVFSYMNIYGKTSTTNNEYYYAMISYDGANVYSAGCNIVGCDNAFRTNSLGSLYIANSSGKVNNYVFYATSGGKLQVNNSTQCNSVATTKTYCTTASLLVISSSFNSWDGTTTSTGSNDNTTESTKTVTYKSTYGDTHRSTVFNSWKNDNTVRQGDYGYGDCNGCWFFGTQFSNLTGKTVTKVTIKITRQSGGSSSAITHTLKAHNHSSRPSGSPAYIGGYAQTFSLATGSATTVTITDSTVLNAISSGSCKGLGLQSSYTSGYYSVCSGNATVTITYK